MARYANLDKEKVWKLTIPQLNYYLKKCHEHIEFVVKLQSTSIQNVMSHVYGGIFGEGSQETGQANVNVEEGEYIDGYKVATPEDMEWLAGIL